MKYCITLILFFVSLVSNGQGLKDYYKDFFPIGVAIAPSHVTSEAESALILREFNSVTAENVMKMGPIHPEENRYEFSGADAIVNFAITNKLKIRGHTLCWHNQTPPWLFVDDAGKNVSKDVLLSRLKSHIQTVVSRYKGKIYGWDVVNEVISDDADKFYRDSKWFEICGEEFIARAFEFAHEADPDAILFYNDYNTENPAKREKIFNMVKKLRENNIPIHAIGIQGHWSIFHPSEKELRETFEKFSSLSLKLQVTELDVSVYPGGGERREIKPDESQVFTAEMEQKQIEQYRMFFRLFREYKNSITGITFWNVSDKRTWLDNFPVRGRKNYPLLFDQQLNRKKAYSEVVKF
jgi:endo-1,4-beta-xylanase